MVKGCRSLPIGRGKQGILQRRAEGVLAWKVEGYLQGGFTRPPRPKLGKHGEFLMADPSQKPSQTRPGGVPASNGYAFSEKRGNRPPLAHRPQPCSITSRIS